MKKSRKPKSGIVLDEPYLNGLLVKAIESGYAKITFPSDYTKKILGRAKNPRVGQKALEMLLLYDKIITPTWFDNNEYEQLIELDLLEIVGSQWTQIAIDESYASSIKSLLLIDLRRRGANITPERFDEILPDVNDLYFGKVVDLAEQLTPTLEGIFRTSREANETQTDTPSLLDMFREQVDTYKKHNSSDFDLSEHIRNSHFHIRNLLNTSTRYNVPIFSNITEIPKLGIHVTENKGDIVSNARIALSIYMNESLSAVPHNSL